VKNSKPYDLYNDFMDMIQVNKMRNLIRVDPFYSKKILVETMMPYLELYFLGRYSFSSLNRIRANKKLKKALKQFSKINPIYGRKILDKNISKYDKNENWRYPENETMKFSLPKEFVFGDSSTQTSQTRFQRIPEVTSLEKRNYYQKVNYSQGYSPTYYMNTHIYKDEEVLDRYIEYGDAFHTYEDNLLEPEPQRPPPQIYIREVVFPSFRVAEMDHSEDENDAEEEAVVDNTEDESTSEFSENIDEEDSIS
jgi:hypothetical protein